MKKFDNVMMDIETLGQGSNAAVFSVGLVAFDSNGLGESQKTLINTLLDTKADVDRSSIEWWDKQSAEAQEDLWLSMVSGKFPRQALLEVEEFFSTRLSENVKVWGNGSDFDNVIVRNLFARFGMEQPWKFWNNRCFRTLKNLVKMEYTKPKIAHDALSDARAQAAHASKILKVLGK